MSLTLTSFCPSHSHPSHVHTPACWKGNTDDGSQFFSVAPSCLVNTLHQNQPGSRIHPACRHPSFEYHLHIPALSAVNAPISICPSISLPSTAVALFSQTASLVTCLRCNCTETPICRNTVAPADSCALIYLAEDLLFTGAVIEGALGALFRNERS